MRIRVCSDLHCDVNKCLDFGFNNKCNDVDLTIIAGDIGGDYKVEESFLNYLKTEKPIVCVGGNHLGYNYLLRGERILNPNDGTKEWNIRELTTAYTGPIHYLENNFIIVNNKIVYGGTMYTNFELYGNPELHKKCAEQGMNDFRYVYTYDGEKIRPIDSDDYLHWYNKFLDELKTVIKNTKEDIIIVSHFAPSIKSISNKYNGRYQHLNPAYASNLEQFILDNPRIKLWVHGHMHDKFDYKIGTCRVVCYPYGYSYDSMITPKQYQGKIVRLK